MLAASVAQCAAVTILFAATRVAPQYWPLGTGEPLLFSAIAHGVSAVCAISPPTIRVCGPSGGRGSGRGGGHRAEGRRGQCAGR